MCWPKVSVCRLRVFLRVVTLPVARRQPGFLHLGFLLAKANEAKLVRVGKVRADTTVVPTNVEYPTDSGLLARAVVKTVAIPRKGRPGTARQALERKPAFRKLVKWRTGCEGRISHLKHRYGWARSRVAGREHAAAWCGLGVLVAHNLVKITTLAAA